MLATPIKIGPQGPAGAAGANGSPGSAGTPGVVAATAPLAYNAGTQTVSIAAASHTSPGSMSAADKVKLDGLGSAMAATLSAVLAAGHDAGGSPITGLGDLTFASGTNPTVAADGLLTVSATGGILVDGQLQVSLSNEDYTNNSGFGSVLLLDNSDPFGQNVVYSQIAGQMAAKWRTDYVGNITWAAGPTGSHDFRVGGDYPDGLTALGITNDGSTNFHGNAVNMNDGSGSGGNTLNIDGATIQLGGGSYIQGDGYGGIYFVDSNGSTLSWNTNGSGLETSGFGVTLDGGSMSSVGEIDFNSGGYLSDDGSGGILYNGSPLGGGGGGQSPSLADVLSIGNNAGGQDIHMGQENSGGSLHMNGGTIFATYIFLTTQDGTNGYYIIVNDDGTLGTYNGQ